jgi:hypothetical protein
MLFLCTSLSASAQVNPFARQRTGERTIIRSGQAYYPDSIERARMDSARIAKLVKNLQEIAPDSLVKVREHIREQLPDSLRKSIFGRDSIEVARDSIRLRDSLMLDSLAKDSLTERQRKRLERKESRTPFISDSMSLRNVCIASAIMPGFGQIYNKQYWKLPILYGTVGTSLGLCLWSNSKYKPLKAEFDRITGGFEDIADYFRCAYRSLALAYKKALDELEENVGERFDKLYIVGGGAKNEFLNKMTAEFTSKQVVALPIEATAIGNLKIQMETERYGIYRSKRKICPLWR